MANFRIYNETLAPELWDASQHLDPKVRMNLLQMAYDFYGKTNLPAPVLDVYLMGSIANYNWTKDSDVDVHVIINYTQLQMPEKTAIKTVKTAGAQWNIEHEVIIKGHKVEMNLQNATEQKPYVTGIYSLVKNQWIRKPFKMSPQVDRNILKVQYQSMRGYVQNALDSRDREQMKAAKKYLDAYRQYGLDTYGELSYENLVFKILRVRGVIKKLKDGIVAVYDKAMSVDEKTGLDELSPELAQRAGDSARERGDSRGVRLSNKFGDYARKKLSKKNTRDVSPFDVEWRRTKDNVRGSAMIDKIERIDLETYELRGKETTMNTAGGFCTANLTVNIVRRTALTYSSDIEFGRKSAMRVAQMIANTFGEKVHATDFPLLEVGYRDIKKHLPNLDDQDYWGKFDSKGQFRLDMLTMDNLNALKEKAARMVVGYESRGKPEWAEVCKADYIKYDNELKRRMQSINTPISESPMMTKKGKTALAGDKPLKGQAVEEVTGNIVVIRQGKGGGFLPEGWTLVYFMDSDESAQAMKQGQIPYLMVPRGTFMSGGSPITDIWLKKFQKPGTHHILGVIEGHSDEETIFIDMVTVRPGWKRNHIAKLMMDRLKKTFPEAKLTTSTQTGDGQKLFKSYGGEQQKTNEGFGSGIPEDDRLKIKNEDNSTRRWQIRSKDAPKTPKMTKEEVIAIPNFDNPIKSKRMTVDHDAVVKRLEPHDDTS
jgi:hypothetical protein